MLHNFEVVQSLKQSTLWGTSIFNGKSVLGIAFVITKKASKYPQKPVTPTNMVMVRSAPNKIRQKNVNRYRFNAKKIKQDFGNIKKGFKEGNYYFSG